LSRPHKCKGSGTLECLDSAFIEADKINYLDNRKRALTLLRNDGRIAAGEALLGGQVIDKKSITEDTEGMRGSDDRRYSNAQIRLSELPISDGVTLARELCRRRAARFIDL
jgi:predicted O-methyltransferase YrrM